MKHDTRMTLCARVCVLEQPQCMEQLVGKYDLVNIVLGTVSRDPSAAWFVDALHVLKLLLNKLGSSLWIGSSFPPETVSTGSVTCTALFVFGSVYRSRKRTTHGRPCCVWSTNEVFNNSDLRTHATCTQPQP